MITFTTPSDEIDRIRAIAASQSSGVSRKAAQRLQDITTRSLCRDLGRAVPDVLERRG